MPRRARIDYPGAFNHVIGRGINKKMIFQKSSEKKEFCKRFRELLEETEMSCYAWSIMDNHFHFLLQTGEVSLATFMSRLLTGYALYYNRVNERVGHLFQNRYKSIVCDKDEYLLNLVRYIHLNPVKAGLVTFSQLEEYEWTGHKELMGREIERCLEGDEVLSYWGRNYKKARAEYKKFVQEGIDVKEDYSGGGLIRSAGGVNNVLKRKFHEREMSDERILGRGDFVEKVLDKIAEKEKCSEFESIEDILKFLNETYALKEKAIFHSRVKSVQSARSLFVYLGNRELGLSIAQMSRELKIGRASGYALWKKGRRLSEELNI